MTDDKKEKFNALGNKIKEHAANAAAQAAENATESGKRGLFGFGSKPTNNAATTNNAQTTTSAKPTTATASAKPTATASVKPTATASVKPTATASVKPTTSTASVKPTTATASVKPTTTTTATTSAKPTAAKVSTPFTDVPASSYYAEAVAWAVQKKITSGVTETTFNPSGSCHRGHAATFLWRSKGSPAPKTANNPFSDVTAESPFYKAILWATENNIIEPKSASAFAPTDPCTRGEVLTYLLRAEGKAGATEADAVKWANLKHLLAGFAGSVSVPCTRADIVTLLYRVKTN